MIEAASLKYSAYRTPRQTFTCSRFRTTETRPTFKPHETPPQHELVDDRWVQESGRLFLRDAPSLGVSVPADVVRSMRLPDAHVLDCRDDLSQPAR